MERTGVLRDVLDNLVDTGAFDDQHHDRRETRWEVGLRYQPMGAQAVLPFSVEQDMVELPELTAWERMEGEYRTMGLHPNGHVMAHLRPQLAKDVLNSQEVLFKNEGEQVRVAGMVIRRQHPQAEAYFLTPRRRVRTYPVNSLAQYLSEAQAHAQRAICGGNGRGLSQRGYAECDRCGGQSSKSYRRAAQGQKLGLGLV